VNKFHRYRKLWIICLVFLFIGGSILPSICGFSRELNMKSSEKKFHNSNFNPITNDDFPDLAIIGNDSNVTILLGDGNGGFVYFKEYNVGQWVTDMTSGDFNNDGFLDLIILNSDDSKTYMLLGDGDGDFKKHRDCRTGKHPLALTSTDFNLDGFLDIAFTHYDSYYISVLFGTGNGGFRTRRKYLAGLEPWGIVSGIFNRDEFPDIAVTDFMFPTVHVLYNRIFGRFGLPHIYLAGEMPIEFAPADFNMDGFLDLAVAIYSGLYHDFTILFNDGWGGFDDYQLIKGGANCSSGIVSGDFNLDGFPDLAYSSVDDNECCVLLNVGNGSFKNHQNYPTGKLPYFVRTADINMDGILDLIMSCYKDKSITIYLGNGDGSFGKRHDIHFDFSPSQIVISNYNTRRTPDAPEIKGKRIGNPREEYNYSFMTRDPCKLDVFYYIDWGDGTVEEWIGPFKSGEKISLIHNWSNQGNYIIKARAKNTDGYLGPWSRFIILQSYEYHSNYFPSKTSKLNRAIQSGKSSNFSIKK